MSNDPAILNLCSLISGSSLKDCREKKDKTPKQIKHFEWIWDLFRKYFGNMHTKYQDGSLCLAICLGYGVGKYSSKYGRHWKLCITGEKVGEGEVSPLEKAIKNNSSTSKYDHKNITLGSMQSLLTVCIKEIWGSKALGKCYTQMKKEKGKYLICKKCNKFQKSSELRCKTCNSFLDSQYTEKIFII